MNFWWCNQNSGWNLERGSGVVCASDAMVNLTFRKTVGDVRLGDIVFHYRNSALCAISHAKENARYCKILPGKFFEDYGSGWIFKADYWDLPHPIPVTRISRQLVALRKKYYPICRTGKVMTGYFFPFDEPGFRVVLSKIKDPLPQWIMNALISQSQLVSLDKLDEAFQRDLAKSLRSTKRARLARLSDAPEYPPKVSVLSYAFKRNPDVIAEVLDRAKGNCEFCGLPAPFIRAPEGTPYLEVHHRIPLADGGKDTVSNAVALCPNCHRKAHYG